MATIKQNNPQSRPKTQVNNPARPGPRSGSAPLGSNPGPKPKPAQRPNPPQSPVLAPRPTKSLFGKIRLLTALVAVALIIKVGAAWYFSSPNEPIPTPPAKPQAETRSTAYAAPSALPANAISAGAAMFINSQVAAWPAVGQASAPAAGNLASSGIPLPPGDENLRRPQSPPPATSSPNRSGPANPAQTRPGAPLPPPAAENPIVAEDQARRSFELTRRETQLSAREQAIKELEADLNVRLAAAERSKNELKDLVTRNEAILEEQKALTQKQKDEEDALKDARVEHLVLAFKGMKPEQAGQLINSMDDAVAVSILSAMPGSAAGKILAMVQPDKAARLIKSISERRIDPKTIIEEHQKAQAQQSRPAPAGGTPAPPSGS